MTHKAKGSVCLGGILAFMLVLASTGASAGNLAIVGTGDGVDMLKAIAARFDADHPGTQTDVPPSIGSGGGVVAIASNREILGRVARKLSDAEVAQGIETLPLVRIPSAFYVHPSVQIKGVTAQQLADIYSGAITSWQAVGGPDLRIRVVRREDGDSTLTALRDTMPGWKSLQITPRSKTAVTTQESIETVRTVEGTIGFGPYSTSLKAGTVVLDIDGLAPTAASYPSAVTLALIYKTSQLTNEARAFLSFAKDKAASDIFESFGGVVIGK